MGEARLAPESERVELVSALVKLKPMSGLRGSVVLTMVEAEALWKELDRLSNVATLHGEAPTGERAGLVGEWRAQALERARRAQEAQREILGETHR